MSILIIILGSPLLSWLHLKLQILHNDNNIKIKITIQLLNLSFIFNPFWSLLHLLYLISRASVCREQGASDLYYIYYFCKCTNYYILVCFIAFKNTKNVRLVSFNLDCWGFWTTFHYQISTEQGSRLRMSTQKPCSWLVIFESVQFSITQVLSWMLYYLCMLFVCCFMRYADFCFYVFFSPFQWYSEAPLGEGRLFNSPFAGDRFLSGVLSRGLILPE